MKTTKNESIKLVADAALLFESKVLLIQYTDTNKYDHQKGWFLPDDLINYNEHPDDAVVRIVKDQLGFDLNNAKIDHVESFTGGDGSWHLVFHYVKELDGLPSIVSNDNINKYEWFELDKLPSDDEIAHHGWAKYILGVILKKIK